ncbi:MAG: tyrosine--tRNA ligase [Rhodospirillaceae bacterium]|jgi:tyrosyl-tRNA synthetase|nr:tyrosine--tRNA ligase [Rhodospirillaceae bacterium]MBT4219941.1 tyrosine--tRNA ligase [Rhodospirillaceae bacterium]MBT4464631.1 tyrosine--tRNA ligase [Rhodospirillaceae bacterium]MBT5309118.1 tyrosine--tRNA ligase [Rhodospirillaceae bacterium]MBT7355727.1 tyrosine--tRNA ligase [Rhodospirillaceae bacterium]
MTSHRSDFIRTLTERGYLHQCTDIDALDAKAMEKTITAYIGFDCTAPSLHAGSLVSIMLLRLMQKNGHKPIVLMGGGTTKVGDPSGKDESRQLLDDDSIAANMAGIKDVFSKFLTFGDGPTDAIMVNNDDWLNDIQYIEFLRDFGRHFSVNRMLGFESVKLRLEREHNLSFLEFNYMILQAYDFLELSRRHGCSLQMGGSDQWGNIINGIDLTRRIDAKELFGLTTPLLTTSSGAKMGKSVGGAIWLNADMLSPYDYWQYWRNTEDADVGRFLRLFTELPLDEIAKLESLEGTELNEAKKRLATEVTTLCHGADAAAEAAETAKKTFEEGGLGDDLPTYEISKADLDSGIQAFELFKQAGLANSNGEARRLIKGGGGRINDEKISDETQTLTSADANADGVIKLSSGKKRHVVVTPV